MVTPHLSVTNNLSFRQRQAGFPEDEIAQRIDDIFKTLSLEEFGDGKCRLGV